MQPSSGAFAKKVCAEVYLYGIKNIHAQFATGFKRLRPIEQSFGFPVEIKADAVSQRERGCKELHQQLYANLTIADLTARLQNTSGIIKTPHPSGLTTNL